MNCSDKMTFDSKQEAIVTATVAAHQRGAKLRVYKCRQCQLWHMASSYVDKE